MPTITTVDATWNTGISMDDAELRRADTAMFLGDGTNNGVRGGIVYHGPTSLGVTVNGSDQVTVQAGAAVIPAATGLGVYRASLSAATAATAISARNATNPRIDLIVAQATGTNMTVKTIDGTPAASPVAPALPAQHIELARITVPAVGGGAVTVDSTWRTFATSIGGVLLVATAARLPGSGNVTGQRAIALDTAMEYVWSGTAWGAQSTANAVESVPQADSTGVLAYLRARSVIVNISLTATLALAAGDSIFVMPVGLRPPATMFGDLIDTTGEVNVRLTVESTGIAKVQTAVAVGRILRGQIVLPL